jgi:hypothetical protein
MSEHRHPARLVAAVVLLFVFTVSAIGQQSPAPTPISAPTSTDTPAPTAPPPPTAAQTRQINRVLKMIGRYDPNTKLDIKLNDGSHDIGKVSVTGSAYFVLVDPVSRKDIKIDYLDVRSVQPTPKEYAAQQLHKTAHALPKIAIVTALVVTAIVTIAVVK